MDTTASSPQSAVTKFVADLPILKLANLRDDQKTCHICLEPFTKKFTQESPVLLPCGHIFGKDCVFKWLSSDGDRSPRSCPMCRVELLPPIDPSWSEPFGEQLREIETLRLPILTPPNGRAVQDVPNEGAEAGDMLGNGIMVIGDGPSDWHIWRLRRMADGGELFS